jgi:hypothetical protein
MSSKRNIKYFAVITVSLAAAGLLLLGAGAANAQTMPVASANGGAWHGRGGTTGTAGRGTFGTVTAVNGTTITVTSKAGPNGTAGATYTVDAANATVMKNGATSSVSNIAVGDTVMVAGTVNGTSITATSIRDGVGQRQPGTRTPAQSPIQGNGEPVVGGTITAVNGTTITVTNKSNVTYTIDASAATVVKGNVTSSIANVATGDNVLVQGTVNGTSVTASSVIDQGAPNSASAAHQGSGGFSGGIFNAIGGFFHKLFGFF